MLNLKKIRKFFKDSFSSTSKVGLLYGQGEGLGPRLDKAMLNEMAKKGICNKIINIKTSNIFKEGFASENSDLGKETLKMIETKLIKEIKRATESMLTYGRGCILIIDGGDLDKPLRKNPNPNALRFKAFTGYDISVIGQVDTHIASPNYNKPLAFMINGIQVHHSRMMDFQYIQPTDTEKPLYDYGGISELELIYKEIYNDSIVSNSLPIIIRKMSTFIFKMAGFHQAVQSGNTSNVLDVVKAMNKERDISGIVVMDKEDDTKVENQTVAGLETVATFTLRKIALVTGIPMSWLVGESAKGLNATGDTEESIFWAMVKNLGNDYVLPVLNEKLQFLGFENVWFNEQFQMTPQERITYETSILNNALILQQFGADEIAYIKERGVEINIKDDFSSEFDADDEEDNQILSLICNSNKEEPNDAV